MYYCHEKITHKKIDIGRYIKERTRSPCIITAEVHALACYKEQLSFGKEMLLRAVVSSIHMVKLCSRFGNKCRMVCNSGCSGQIIP